MVKIHYFRVCKRLEGNNEENKIESKDNATTQWVHWCSKGLLPALVIKKLVNLHITNTEQNF